VRTIETVNEIEAPTEIVWDVVTDFARYGEWNPFITALAGELHPGARLRATFSLAGRRPRTFTPTLTAVEPGRRLAWRGCLAVAGLFDAEHMFALEPRDTRTRFVHRETFRGMLVPFVRRTLAATHDAFVRMDDALVGRAQAIARHRP
jgi:hypothetical protein